MREIIQKGRVVCEVVAAAMSKQLGGRLLHILSTTERYRAGACCARTQKCSSDKRNYKNNKKKKQSEEWKLPTGAINAI